MNRTADHGQGALHWLLLASASLLLAACASTPRQTGPVVPADAGQPQILAGESGPVVIASARGNPPFYEVFGERYFVLPTSAGYREQGIASWYGPDFHGKLTSTGEVYDMHAMTAAHPSLPLPTEVRVTNLSNGKSVVVTVNDRGPFARNRIIDLSYAAAKAIDMIGPGTAPVEVKALNVVHRTAADAEAAGVLVSAATVIPEREMYMQVGAFGLRENAERMREQMEQSGLAPVMLHHDGERGLYRVWLGPLSGADEYDALLARVRVLNIRDVQLVTAAVSRSTEE